MLRGDWGTIKREGVGIGKEFDRGRAVALAWEQGCKNLAEVGAGAHPDVRPWRAHPWECAPTREEEFVDLSGQGDLGRKGRSQAGAWE
jgi:hypothetical protein